MYHRDKSRIYSESGKYAYPEINYNLFNYLFILKC